MGNMRKKIAFLAGAISFDNQNRVIDGVLRRAAEFDTDVFIFTCWGFWVYYAGAFLFA